jgi:hypothetical protein
MKMWKTLLVYLSISAAVSMGTALYFARNTDIVSELGRMPASIKSLKLPPMDLEPVVKKQRSPLWSCGCGNYSEKEQTARRCSKGFAFKTMTEAAQYAKSKCGEGCEVDCRAQNFDPEDQDATANL